jgi:hypothetical protein
MYDSKARKQPTPEPSLALLLPPRVPSSHPMRVKVEELDLKPPPHPKREPRPTRRRRRCRRRPKRKPPAPAPSRCRRCSLCRPPKRKPTHSLCRRRGLRCSTKRKPAPSSLQRRGLRRLRSAAEGERRRCRLGGRRHTEYRYRRGRRSLYPEHRLHGRRRPERGLRSAAQASLWRLSRWSTEYRGWLRGRRGTERIRWLGYTTIPQHEAELRSRAHNRSTLTEINYFLHTTRPSFKQVGIYISALLILKILWQRGGLKIFLCWVVAAVCVGSLSSVAQATLLYVFYHWAPNTVLNRTIYRTGTLILDQSDPIRTHLPDNIGIFPWLSMNGANSRTS